MPVMHSLYREAGAVAIDEQDCIRCGECVAICPAEVLSLEGEHVRIHTDSPFGCIACGHCMMICPNNCIRVTGRGLSPDDLRPMPAQDTRATADRLAALMQTRRSIRRFTNQEVPKATLDQIVGMAATAPMGIPPWDVGCVIVCGHAAVRSLSDAIIKGYSKLFTFLTPWTLALMRPFLRRATYDQFKHFILPLGQTYLRYHHQGRDVLFYDAPAVLLFHHSPYTEAADAVIACTYAMLAAESLGLGTTVIGAAAPVLQQKRPLCRSLGIPDGNKPSIALILGYPASTFLRTLRRSFSAVTTTRTKLDT